jgi:hypothetical protein
MNEEFLHYLWKYRLLDPELRTVAGEPLTVLHPGEHNRDGGPDFFNARLKINGTTWAGNVEIHVRASSWYRHRHHHDRAYDNVILHVVYENDADVLRTPDEQIQTLIMKGHFPEYIYERYRDFKDNQRWIPCEALVGNTDPFVIAQWIPALAVERLEEKILLLKKNLEASKFDWEETFYCNLARSFGFRINAQPFELLARSLPWKVLQKHCENLFQLEALLFGQAGLLAENLTEEYPRLLVREYRFLKEKYGLHEIPGSTWKSLRLRPSNFPAIRIAQFASLVHQRKDLYRSVLECNHPEELILLFSVQASAYWDSHFVFGKWSAPRPRMLGADSIRLITINLVAPFYFLYGEAKALPSFKEKGLAFLELLPPESNSDLSRWKGLGITAIDALHTQALIHLKSCYCDKRRCLECRIGNALLNGEMTK